MRLSKQDYTSKGGPLRKTRNWYVELRFRGERVRLPAYRDKKASNEFGCNVQKLAELVESGRELPPETRKWLESLDDKNRNRLTACGLLKGCELGSLKRLTEHIADFLDYLRQQRVSEKHVKMRASMLAKLVEHRRFKWWQDLTPATVREALASLQRERGFGAQTFNHYLVAFQQFCLWMIEVGRAFENPTRGIKKANVALDPRHPRRALTEGELNKLFGELQMDTVRKKVPSEYRSILYQLAMFTGLRLKELGSLTVSSFDLDSEQPTVRIKATDAKGKRAGEIPLSQGMAEQLKLLFSGKPKDSPALTMPPEGHAAKMLRADLEAAGVDYVNAEGLYADFHSLRHTFVTMLERTGCSPKTMQSLARHSTPNLTLGVYAHSAKDIERQAIENFPVIPTLAATLSPSKNLGAGLVQQAVQHRTNTDPKVIESTFVRGVDGPAKSSHPVTNFEVAPETASHGETRRGGRVVDCVGFENRFARKGNGGSNPPPSARFSERHRRAGS